MTKDEILVLLAFLLSAALLIGFGVGVFYLFRGYEYLARRSLARRYADLEIHDERRPGDVLLVYHTYHGLIVWFTQTPHHVFLPPEAARILLGRLLRFNLKWGLVTYGALFVPPLAILNYMAQRQSLTRQEALGGFRMPKRAAWDEATKQVLVPPSLFRQFVGWILAILTVQFGIATVIFLIRGDYKPFLGGLIFTPLLGWVARDWLRKRPLGGE